MFKHCQQQQQHHIISQKFRQSPPSELVWQERNFKWNTSTYQQSNHIVVVAARLLAEDTGTVQG